MGPPTEFQTIEGYYQPQDAGLFFSLPPVLLAGLALLLILVGLLGWWLGRRRSPSDDPCDAIYEAVRKAISTAAEAPRDSVISAGRQLKSALDDRLGAVLTLAGGVHAAKADLDRALKGVGADPHHGSGDDHGSDHGAGHGSDSDKPDVTPTIVINAPHAVNIHTADASATAHGHKNGLSADEQIALIRAAVHALSDHWTDKPARLAELSAARRQLTTPVRT